MQYWTVLSKPLDFRLIDNPNNTTNKDNKMNEPLTRGWQKWRFIAPQSHLWLIKVRSSALIPIAIGMLKTSTFAKPQTVMPNPMSTQQTTYV